MEYCSVLKRKEILSFPSMDKLRKHGQQARSTTPDTEGQVSHDFIYKWNLEK